jgi:hypothetical protein
MRILDRLGGEGVDVELTETQLDAALQRALELWAKHRPFLRWYPFELPAADVVISFFSETAQASRNASPLTFVRSVLDVTFMDEERPIAGSNDSYSQRWGFAGPRIFFEVRVAERTSERLAGTRADWYWDPKERKLYVSTPSRSQRCMALTARERFLEEVEYYHESDFLKAATAQAKLVLARVLGSMGDIPGPAGPIQTDHETLRTTGTEEWREVETMMQNTPASYPPPQWVG